MVVMVMMMAIAMLTSIRIPSLLQMEHVFNEDADDVGDTDGDGDDGSDSDVDDKSALCL